MAKRYYWELHRVFVFGEPLKVFSLEVQRETGGQPLSYYKLDLAIENNPHLWTRLMAKVKGPIEHFPRLHLLEHRDPSDYTLPGSQDVMPLRQYTFWDAWLFSLVNHSGSYQGPVLGVAFDKRPEHGASITALKHHRIY